jgi:hypothetical protein
MHRKFCGFLNLSLSLAVRFAIASFVTDNSLQFLLCHDNLLVIAAASADNVHTTMDLANNTFWLAIAVAIVK